MLSTSISFTSAPARPYSQDPMQMSVSNAQHNVWRCAVLCCVSRFVQAIGASERVLAHLNDQPAPQLAAGIRPHEQLRGEVEMRGVGYTYPNRCVQTSHLSCDSGFRVFTTGPRHIMNGISAAVAAPCVDQAGHVPHSGCSSSFSVQAWPGIHPLKCLSAMSALRACKQGSSKRQ